MTFLNVSDKQYHINMAYLIVTKNVKVDGIEKFLKSIICG